MPISNWRFCRWQGTKHNAERSTIWCYPPVKCHDSPDAFHPACSLLAGTTRAGLARSSRRNSWRTKRQSRLPQALERLKRANSRWNRSEIWGVPGGGAPPVFCAQAPTTCSSCRSFAADHPPLLIRARHAAQFARTTAAARALPSGVRGPVLMPPCHLHRVRPGTTGQQHGSPSRLRLAPQRTRPFFFCSFTAATPHRARGGARTCCEIASRRCEIASRP